MAFFQCVSTDLTSRVSFHTYTREKSITEKGSCSMSLPTAALFDQDSMQPQDMALFEKGQNYVLVLFLKWKKRSSVMESASNHKVLQDCKAPCVTS